jgi:hypothetical protein
MPPARTIPRLSRSNRGEKLKPSSLARPRKSKIACTVCIGISPPRVPSVGALILWTLAAPVVDRTTEEPPPFVVLVHGPPQVVFLQCKPSAAQVHVRHTTHTCRSERRPSSSAW